MIVPAGKVAHPAGAEGGLQVLEQRGHRGGRPLLCYTHTQNIYKYHYTKSIPENQTNVPKLVIVTADPQRKHAQNWTKQTSKQTKSLKLVFKLPPRSMVGYL